MVAAPNRLAGGFEVTFPRRFTFHAEDHALPALRPLFPDRPTDDRGNERMRLISHRDAMLVRARRYADAYEALAPDTIAGLCALGRTGCAVS